MTDDRPDSLGRPLNLSRREVIAAMSAVGVAAALGVPESAAQASAAATARRASRARSFAADVASVAPAGSDLGAIDHIVFLMMENRSYDHYFGAYHRGRGFDDHPKHSVGVFAQDYPGGKDLSPRKKLFPFHLTVADEEDCTKDLTHNWGPQHESWNQGKMDHWVKTHTDSQYEGDPDGALTMGYYTRRELPYLWALADHFTLCDGYHASILGPTHPNRVMAQTGTIDPAGKHGGPITDTNVDPRVRWTCHWPTVQELLEDKGVSWKVYSPSNVGTTGRYARLSTFPTFDPYLTDPVHNPEVMFTGDNILPYFKAFEKQSSPLHKKAFHPTWPNDFVADCKSGRLPKVSWIIPPIGFDEHPSAPPLRGQWFTQEVIRALSSHKKLWSRTALFLMYDENDGFFDHVSPPTARPGTPGEWLTAKEISGSTNGIRGPLGLGVRVPMLVISPFSRGGHNVSHLYDHTSQLQLLEARFGIEVGHLSKWRRHKTGNLTHALFRGHHDASMPHLPRIPLGSNVGTGSCASEDSEFGGAGPTIPTNQRMPTQHGKTVPATRYFKAAPTSKDRVPAQSNRNTATKKSAANPLAHGGAPVQPERNRNR